MAIELISKIKPKNGGTFPLVDGVDIAVAAAANDTIDSTANEGNLLRRSFHLGGPISLGSHTGYRINRLAVRAAAGTAVRFALYGVESGVLTQLEILGDAVADDTQVAALDLGGHEVRQDNTIILAFAREAVLHCLQLDESVSVSGGVQFSDGDYFDNENGARIPWYDSAEAVGGVIMSAACARDIDFLTEQTLEDYLKAANARFDGLEQGDGGLPAVTALDNGKFLRVENGAWAAAAVDDAEGVSF